MENATKAIIMAGTVLISILLISFLLVLLRKGGAANAEYDTTMSDTELAKFNSQFEVYDRDNNTYFDVITVCNLAYDINNRTEDTITVSVTMWDNTKGANVTYKINKATKTRDKFSDGTNMYSLVSDNSQQVYKDDSDHSKGKKYKYLYKCKKISYNETTGKVESI